MAAGQKRVRFPVATVVLLLAFATGGVATAQLVDEDFDTVTGTGGGVFLDQLGSGWFVDWDDGIFGESAMGQATGLARVQMSAQGLPGGGVGGTGAGQLAVLLDSLNMVEEYLDSVTGTGGGAFLVGDGYTPNLSATTSDWDDGIEDESAFCYMRSGAVLNGDASAQGLTNGGLGGTGGGQIAVTDVTLNGGNWYAGLAWSIPVWPGGSGVLQNPGFELGLWDTIAGWDVWCDTSGSYPSVLIVTTDPQAGSQDLKVWGRASGMNSAGVAQELRAEPGQTWQLDCWSSHHAADGIDGTSNYAEMRIEFYDGISEEPLATTAATVLDGSSPLDTWIDNTPIQLTAPAGTLTVRAALQLVHPGSDGGAVFFDTVSFQVISGPPAFDRSEYSLTADIKGDANTAEGEIYGHYQLRVEDADGDRLVFESPVVADGTWQAIGGTLDQAIEKNSSDVPATGVFDFDSETFRVMLLFDPTRAPTWGTGGSLIIDNLVLTNDRPDGSDFSGALVWDLPPMSTLDPRYVTMSADVQGNVVGAKYELRLQGYVAIPNVDEDFAAITTDTEVQIAATDETDVTFEDWNSQIDNEEAFFHAVDATVTATGGVWVRGLTTGGYGDNGSCMQIEVRDVWPEDYGYWYAGAAWRDQILASTNLANVTISAKVKGTWNESWLQEPAQYILRLEDPDGDWIGFDQVYDGTYQSIGGPLSGYTVSGFADGSNGVFDLDTNLSYAVVIMFIGEGPPSSAYGNWGGTLTVDDVYLSPSPAPRLKEAGHVSFAGTADGTFQSVGAVLADGESTWPPEGGQFYPEWGSTITSWDIGIEGETAFAGFGWGASIETASVEGCTDCGVGGGGGGKLTVTGIQSPPGWYWAGVAWPGIEINMSNLSQVSFTADCKGVWDPGAGESAGMITLRLEDQNGRRISWDSPAVDGTFHTLGGTLNTFTAEDGFDTSAPSYIATIIVFGYRTPTWGTGATVYFDNVAVSDPSGALLAEDFETVVGPVPGSLVGMDAFAVTLSMQNGLFTWGDGASLVVDNLQFGMLPHSCDEDSDVDLLDFATFQSCFSGDGGGVGGGCTCVDVDGDGDIDQDDMTLLSGFYTGPE
ncbi:MAG: hypothetical protein PVJ57_18510 [Phycisphaerae bacterium]|jgi:hypothetical protein